MSNNNKEMRSLRATTISSEAIVTGILSLLGIGVRELARRSGKSPGMVDAMRKKKNMAGIIEAMKLAKDEHDMPVRVTITIEPDGTGQVTITEVDTPDSNQAIN